MKKILLVFSLSAFLAVPVFGQWSKEEMERIGRLSWEDHRLMMKKLGITELRRGPSGNPSAPNAANSDESKATPYTSLPDPLVFKDGKRVKTAEQWEKRKVEIFEDFDREIYGRVPANTPGVAWEVVSEKDSIEGEIPISTKQLVGHVDNSGYPAITVDIQMTLTTPKKADAAVPVIVEFGWNFPMGWGRRKPAGPTWKEQVLAKGWGYVSTPS